MLKWFRYGACGLATALLVADATGAALAASEPKSTGGNLVVRRLSADQYKATLISIFGQDIDMGGRFEPDQRESGLLAVGASRVSVTSTGLERYEAAARAIAAQVVDEKHRGTLIPCTPANARAADDACASAFLSNVGKLLYRRTLTPEELAVQVRTAHNAAETVKSFHEGLAITLSTMLTSPQFLFYRERSEPDPANKGALRLTAASKASRLSFLLWNAGPDKELIAAAESGGLDTPKGIARQVERMMASPRFETGVRAFFSDMLQLDNFAALTKDAMIYPKFTIDVARDAREQTLRTAVDHLIVRNGDYRDLFTTPHTFLTPILGTVYEVPVAPIDELDSAAEGWQPFSYAEGDPRAGFLAQASFVALHSHPGRSSPTLRGKALREILFCQTVPDPPANVDFTLVQDTKHATYRTARARVEAHLLNPMCAGCHKLIDPMGLGLENFDSSGAFRTTENGVKIDASGEINGKKFDGAAGLAKAVHDSPQTASCLVNRVFAYSVGRPLAKGETEFVQYLESGFAADGYRLPALLKRLATSEAFYRVAPPEMKKAELPTQIASQTQESAK